MTLQPNLRRCALPTVEESELVPMFRYLAIEVRYNTLVFFRSVEVILRNHHIRFEEWASVFFSDDTF